MAWLQMLSYLRCFAITGPLVVVFIETITKDLLRWLIVYACVILGFSTAFTVMFINRQDRRSSIIEEDPDQFFRNLWVSIITNLGLMLGEPISQSLMDEAASPGTTKLLYVLEAFISAILLINVLIGLMTNTFNRVELRATQEFVMQRAEIILEMEERMTVSQRIRLYDSFLHSPTASEMQMGDVESDQTKSVLKSMRTRPMTSSMQLKQRAKTNLRNQQLRRRL